MNVTAPTTWIEIRMSSTDGPDELRDLYRLVDSLAAESIHHFFDEPWWPDRAVVRVQINADEAEELTSFYARDDRETASWDATPDEEAFGDDWPLVAAFFESASRLSLVPSDDWRNRKLVHCALNVWGYSKGGEFLFGYRMCRGRIRLLLHDIYHRAIGQFRRDGRCKYGCHRPSWDPTDENAA